MLNVKQFRDLCRMYKEGVTSSIELSGRSEAWLEGFFYAFERMDELADEFLTDSDDENQGSG